MYKVDLYARVRYACHVEGKSVREAARVFGKHKGFEPPLLLVLRERPMPWKGTGPLNDRSHQGLQMGCP